MDARQVYEEMLKLPDLRDTAMEVSKNKMVGNEFVEAFTIEHLLFSPKSGFMMLELKSPSGKLYRYQPMPIEFDNLRKKLAKIGKIRGVKVIMSFFQGSMGAGGAISSPNVVVSMGQVIP